MSDRNEIYKPHTARHAIISEFGLWWQSLFRSLATRRIKKLHRTSYYSFSRLPLLLFSFQFHIFWNKTHTTTARYPSLGVFGSCWQRLFRFGEKDKEASSTDEEDKHYFSYCSRQATTSTRTSSSHLSIPPSETHTQVPVFPCFSHHLIAHHWAVMPIWIIAKDRRFNLFSLLVFMLIYHLIRLA